MGLPSLVVWKKPTDGCGSAGARKRGQRPPVRNPRRLPGREAFGNPGARPAENTENRGSRIEDRAGVSSILYSRSSILDPLYSILGFKKAATDPILPEPCRPKSRR